MKSCILSFLSLIALVAATDLPHDEQIARALAESGVQDQIVRAVTESRALRGSRDPMEMSPEESAREALVLCKVLNTVIPANVMPCTCDDQVLNGFFKFECKAVKPRCVAIGPLGSVCTTTRITGKLLLQFFQLTTTASVKACGIQNNVVGTLPGTSYSVVDVCANMNATMGKVGTGVDDCGVTLGNRTCSSCTDCKKGNANGLGFNCGGLINFCLPVNLPIFVDKPPVKGATVDQVVSPKAWDDAVMSLAVIAAQQQAPPQQQAPQQQQAPAKNGGK